MLTAVSPATTTPHIAAGHILGGLGVGGAALACTVILILGVRGKGIHKLSHEQAGLLGFISGTLYVSAGQVWAAASSLSGALTGTFSGSNGAFGDVQQGAVALVLTAWFALGKPRPLKGALLGIMAAGVYGTAGGIWQIAPALVDTLLSHLGVS